jgi:perosamine synthetase
MSNVIPIALPELGEAEAQAAREAILSGWVTQGPRVAAFEDEFAQKVGAAHAIAVSNCTVALHLALKAVGVRRGDDVLLPSHSFIATANAVTYLGARPVFVDIQPGTFNIDPSLLALAITSKTAAILVVHQVGMPADMEAILRIADEHKLPVVEDAACAIGSKILHNRAWENIGKPHGDVACFSFHPRKLLTTGDGGMLTTSRADYAENFRRWRQHGMSVPDTVRHNSSKVVFEEYLEVAYNYRMTDIQAAIGREQLKRLDGMLLARRRLAARYQEKLSEVPGLELPAEPEYARSNWQTFLVRLPIGFDQYEVMQNLYDLGISTRRGIMCAHREPAYNQVDWSCGMNGNCSCAPATCERLVESERAQDRCIALPLFSTMTKQQQDDVIDGLKQVLKAIKKEYHADTTR